MEFICGIFRAPLLLCSDDGRIRTGFFRLLRLLLLNEQRLRVYLDLMVDIFAVRLVSFKMFIIILNILRSLDILLLQKSERLEAFRLLAQMLNLYVRNKISLPNHIQFPTSAIKSIHEVAVHRIIFVEIGEAEPKIDEYVFFEKF